ncbi:MAG: glutamate-5-semialdehyde dehydrogenase [Planctomycetota bacterium]
MSEVKQIMAGLGQQARRASAQLSLAATEQKRTALTAAAIQIRDAFSTILGANEKDVQAAHSAGKPDSMIDRLVLDLNRVESIAGALEEISRLDDPVGSVICKWDRPNGLGIQRVRTPLGVIGVIYESRPNVTADAGALAMMSGNSVILRGGSDSFHSSTEIHKCLLRGLESAGLDPHCIQLVPTTDREAVGEMLRGLDGNMDVIVPRGGRSLVDRVQTESRVPVFAHLEGICHVYVDRDSDLQMARDIVLNSKMRRTGICGAAETLLVDQACRDSHLGHLLGDLSSAGCEIRGDQAVCESFDHAVPASDADWATEYLDAIISVRIVDGVEAAINHIGDYSSGHTESIVTRNADTAAKFLREVDSAIVLHNASTQFADGGEFGMGAEIGIATGRMHARGPIGVEQLTTFKYVVSGSGQIRPA